MAIMIVKTVPLQTTLVMRKSLSQLLLEAEILQPCINHTRRRNLRGKPTIKSETVIKGLMQSSARISCMSAKSAK